MKHIISSCLSTTPLCRVQSLPDRQRFNNVLVAFVSHLHRFTSCCHHDLHSLHDIAEPYRLYWIPDHLSLLHISTIPSSLKNRTISACCRPEPYRCHVENRAISAYTTRLYSCVETPLRICLQGFELICSQNAFQEAS